MAVTCLATDASLTADPGVVSLIPTWSHTFVEIDHSIITILINFWGCNCGTALAGCYSGTLYYGGTGMVAPSCTMAPRTGISENLIAAHVHSFSFFVTILHTTAGNYWR